MTFKSDTHAFKAGMFYAAFRQRWAYIEPVYDEKGYFTPRFVVRDNTFGKVTIEVLPPEEGQ